MAQATVSRLQKVVILRLSVILRSHTVKSGVDAIHHSSGPEMAFCREKIAALREAVPRSGPK